MWSLMIGNHLTWKLEVGEILWFYFIPIIPNIDYLDHIEHLDL